MKVCALNYKKKKIVEKPLKTKWCLDQQEVEISMAPLPVYRQDEDI